MPSDKRKLSPEKEEEQRSTKHNSIEMSYITLEDLKNQLTIQFQTFRESMNTDLQKIVNEVNTVSKKVDILDTKINIIEQNALLNTAIIFDL